MCHKLYLGKSVIFTVKYTCLLNVHQQMISLQEGEQLPYKRKERDEKERKLEFRCFSGEKKYVMLICS